MALFYRARKRELLCVAKKRGITPNPYAIAMRLGMSQQTVRRALNGGNASAATVLALSHGLDVPVTDIFRVIDNPD